MSSKVEKRKTCFVVGPIGDDDSPERAHADWLFHDLIKPVISEFADYDVVRADVISTPGMIDGQIINHLVDCDLVIADMSFLNANAFYELGIRHAHSRATIHMIRRGDRIPFDLNQHRAIVFSRERWSDWDKARTALRSAVQETLAVGYEPENPVTIARGRAKLKEHATPEVRTLMTQIDALQSRIVNLESSRPQGLGAADLNAMNRLLHQAPKEKLAFAYFFADKIIDAQTAQNLVNAAPTVGLVARRMFHGDNEILIAAQGDAKGFLKLARPEGMQIQIGEYEGNLKDEFDSVLQMYRARFGVDRMTLGTRTT